MRDADFAATRYRDDAFDPLTPDNRAVFLYAGSDLDELHRANLKRLSSSEPLARSDFNVYADGGTLTYLKTPCDLEDGWFFLHAFPLNPDDLPPERRASGFYGYNFRFTDRSVFVDDACVLMAYLPNFPVASFRTGQHLAGGEPIWSVDAKPPPDADTLAAYESAYQAITSSSPPAARSDWDVYLDGKTISYLKSPCAEEDARGRFLLSVFPQNPRDIPEDRRALGHESLNFDFATWGAIFNGKCLVRRPLPNYAVEKVETGQWIPGGERLWFLVVGD